jgi:hypothetical protein
MTEPSDVSDFDVYFAGSGIAPGSLAVGQRVRLDGIDGFFDEYFAGLVPGELIRFLVYPHRQGAVGVTTAEVAELPLVSARIIAADMIGGTVEVIEAIPFAAWLHGLPAQVIVGAGELREMTHAPIEDLLAEAKRAGTALWVNTATRIRDLNHVTAVYAQAEGEPVRVAVLRTNAVPGSVADVIF